MISLSTTEGFAIAGTTGILLFILYRSVTQQRSPSGLSFAPLGHRGNRPTLFESSFDGAWDPSEIPVEPDENVYYTDEERVLRLLIVNDGQMQQSKVVRETGWSSAKVSRLLHRMENRNDISRVSAGRTKMVYLGQYRVDEEPDTREYEKC